MAIIEGTGIKEPSKEAKVASLKFLRNPKKFIQEKVDQKLDSMTKSGKTPFGTSIGGSAVGEEGLGRFGNPNDLSDASETFKKKDFFSMTTDPRNEIKLASASDDVSGTFDNEDYNNYLKAAGIKYPKTLPDIMNRMLRENYIQDKKEGIYKDGQIFNTTDTLLNKAPAVKEEKPSFLAQTKNFAGSVFDAITGTQSASASQIGGPPPNSGFFSPRFASSNLNESKNIQSGDTSFAAYRMAGEPKKSALGIAGSGTGVKTEKSDTPFADGGRGVNLPSDYGDTEAAAFKKAAQYSAQKAVNVDGQNFAPRQTVASLPSDYKQTEAKAFAAADAYQRAKKNPNVKAGVDSKGQVSVKPANDSAKAKAQAAAYQRKASGKSISQTKAANNKAMRDRASERNKAFQAAKKAGKLTKSQRTAAGQRAANKAAAKARAKAAAKARRKKKSKK